MHLPRLHVCVGRGCRRARLRQRQVILKLSLHKGRMLHRRFWRRAARWLHSWARPGSALSLCAGVSPLCGCGMRKWWPRLRRCCLVTEPWRQ